MYENNNIYNNKRITTTQDQKKFESHKYKNDELYFKNCITLRQIQEKFESHKNELNIVYLGFALARVHQLKAKAQEKEKKSFCTHLVQLYGTIKKNPNFWKSATIGKTVCNSLNGLQTVAEGYQQVKDLVDDLIEYFRENWADEELQFLANSVYSLGVLGVSFEGKNDVFLKILKAIHSGNWKTPIPHDIAHTVNGLVKLLVRVEKNSSDLQPMLKKVIILILGVILIADWKQVTPMDITVTLNQLPKLLMSVIYDVPDLQEGLLEAVKGLLEAIPAIPAIVCTNINADPKYIGYTLVGLAKLLKRVKKSDSDLQEKTLNVVKKILDAILSVTWAKAEPSHTAETLNGLAQLPMSVEYDDPDLQNRALEALKWILKTIPSVNWAKAEPRHIADTLNGLSKLLRRLKDNDPDLKIRALEAVKVLLEAVINSASEINWKAAKPIAIANTLNGLAQLLKSLKESDKESDPDLQGKTREFIKVILDVVSDPALKIKWKETKPIAIANTLNGLAQLLKRLKDDDPDLKTRVREAVKLLLEAVINPASEINWKAVKPIAIANTLNGLAQLPMSVEYDGSDLKPRALEAVNLILEAFPGVDWPKAEPRHIANTLNGLAQLLKRLKVDHSDLQGKMREGIEVILDASPSVTWTKAEPRHIANMLNGLAQLGIRLEKNHPALETIIKSIHTISWADADPSNIVNTLNALCYYNIEAEELKRILVKLEIKDRWFSFFKENIKDRSSISHVAGYIHFILKEDDLKKDYPLQKSKLCESITTSPFQVQVKHILETAIPTCNILMEYHHLEFAYLASPIDIALQDKVTEKVIAFVEVEGPTHFDSTKKFNLATDLKHRLLNAFAEYYGLKFGIVSSPEENLQEDEIIKQLEIFIEKINSDPPLNAQMQQKNEDPDKGVVISCEKPTNLLENEKNAELNDEQIISNIEHRLKNVSTFKESIKTSLESINATVENINIEYNEIAILVSNLKKSRAMIHQPENMYKTLNPFSEAMLKEDTSSKLVLEI